MGRVPLPFLLSAHLALPPTQCLSLGVDIRGEAILLCFPLAVLEFEPGFVAIAPVGKPSSGQLRTDCALAVGRLCVGRVTAVWCADTSPDTP